MDSPTLDFRLIEIELELFALEDHLNLIEQQIRNKEAFEKIKSRQNIKKLSLTPEDPEWYAEQQELDYILEFLIPRFFRGPFLVSLYAVYESAIIEIAKLIQKKRGTSISINDIKGDFFERANKYYKDVIDFPLYSDDEAWQRIKMFSVLRHAIAHANGRIEMLNDKTKQSIANLEKQKVGVSSMSGFVIIEERFLKDTLGLIRESLNNLVKQYKMWDNQQRAHAGKPVPQG